MAPLPAVMYIYLHPALVIAHPGPTPACLPVQAALERALAAQMRGAVAQPLQEAFHASFQGTLVPAFESACQTMFSQVAP